MRDYSFERYLAAKKSVDDRALNSYVWQTLATALPVGPRNILEIGAGIGTMIERLSERRGILDGGRYTAIDAMPANIAAARKRLDSLPLAVELELEAVDLFDFIRLESGQRSWDLLIAHAFLDLVDAPAVLPDLFSLLRPEGLFYFTINFDGLTILEPVIDAALDERIMALYHQTMDERLVAGQLSGDSRTGRHLLRQIPEAGGRILATGSSDWVVVPGRGGYLADEAYFLHFIIHTIEQALVSRPELDAAELAGWIARRHAQVDKNQLIYIAHQLDICGTVAG